MNKIIQLDFRSFDSWCCLESDSTQKPPTPPKNLRLLATLQPCCACHAGLRRSL